MAKTYVVKKGDTLLGIAKAQGVAIRHLRKANNLTTDTIKTGQTLVLPTKPAATKAAAIPAKAAAKPAAKPAAKKPAAEKLFIPDTVQGGTVDAVLAIAYKELGYQEGPRDNETKYGAALKHNFTAWCGVFVNWVCKQAGVKIPNTFYTPNGALSFKTAKSWYTWKGGTVPQPGDIIYFDFPGDGVERISHVGICVRTLPNGRVLCIEGNTGSSDPRNGGSVQLCSRSQSCIVGWGRPKYKDAPLTVVIPNTPSQTYPRN